jgi:23S rRNA pseudouridine1911/1915/1917 synthase
MSMPQRTFTVGRSESGQTLGDYLRQRLALPVVQVRQLLRTRQVRVAGTPCQDVGRRLRPGQRIDVHLSGNPDKKPSSLAEVLDKLPVPPVVCHVDDAIVVVNKPAGLTTMRHAEDVKEQGARARRYLPPTLADLVPLLLRPHTEGRTVPVRAVHRLDKETSGLVVFARTVEAERHLGGQLRAHTVQRLYRALVRGKAKAGRIESLLVDDRGDGRRGSNAEQGQRAVTHVAVVEELGEFTLVECRLETGRTHQVRIHLGEAGIPLCGDRIYDRPVHVKPWPDGSGAGRVMLHAAMLGLVHPVSSQALRWSVPLPRDMDQLLKRLRQQATPRPPSS